MGFINVLHTNTKYGYFGDNLLSGITNDSDTVIRERFLAAIDNLESQEANFYGQFGFGSAAQFFAALGNFIKKSESDMLILQKFNATILGPILDSYKDPSMNLDKFYMVVDNSKARIKLKPLLEQLAAPGVEITGTDKLGVSVIWDTKKMKELVNGLKTRHRFNTTNSADSSTALIKYLRQGAEGLIQIYEDYEHYQNNEVLEFANSPFAYSTEDLSKMDDKQLEQIRKNIKNFIFDRIGINSGSKALIDAAETVWNATETKLFVGGAGGLKSWKRNVIGNLGEFQTAVFFQYFANACPNRQTATKISEIIGSDMNQAKEKMRSDVTLLGAFGVQVKNYNSGEYTKYLKGGGTETLQRRIDIKMHPMQVPSLTSDNELLNYVINSYFNIDFGPPSEEEWKIFFTNHADEVLNLNGYKPQEYSDPYGFINFNDRVTFYMIRGYFIPGSVVMRGAMNSTLNVSDTEVAAKYKHDTSYFYGKDKEARLLKWWIYKEGVSPAEWEPTENNELSEWDKNISIRTSFEYQNIIKSMPMYKIF